MHELYKFCWFLINVLFTLTTQHPFSLYSMQHINASYFMHDLVFIINRCWTVRCFLWIIVLKFSIGFVCKKEFILTFQRWFIANFLSGDFGLKTKCLWYYFEETHIKFLNVYMQVFMYCTSKIMSLLYTCKFLCNPCLYLI